MLAKESIKISSAKNVSHIIVICIIIIINLTTIQLVKIYILDRIFIIMNALLPLVEVKDKKIYFHHLILYFPYWRKFFLICDTYIYIYNLHLKFFFKR